jgi:hypothetical protein
MEIIQSEEIWKQIVVFVLKVRSDKHPEKQENYEKVMMSGFQLKFWVLGNIYL